MSERRNRLGHVEAALPQGLYRVRLEDGATVTASMAAEARRTIVRILPGDRVLVGVSPFDPTRGKITEKVSTHRNEGTR